MKKTAFFILALTVLLSLAPVRSSAAQEPQDFYSYLPIIGRPKDFLTARLGPNIGRVIGMSQDPFSPSVVYAAAFGSGVYKSIDYGTTWAPASAGITYLDIESLAVDPFHPNTLYTGTYGSDQTPYSGVFKSNDGGVTWQATGELANVWNGVRYNKPVVYALAVDPCNPSRVFAGTRMKFLPTGALGGGGVFRSDDAGATWSPVNNGLPNEDLYIYDLAMDPAHPGRIYAALHEHGLYRSDNYGNSWYHLGGTPYAGRAVSVDPYNPSRIYFGAVKKLSIFRSEDSGANWSQIGGANWDVTVGTLSPDLYHQGRVYAAILDNNTSYRLLRSTNNGSSWGQVASLNAWGRMAFSPDGNNAYTAVDFDGPYKSQDGGITWNRSAQGLSGFSVTGLAASALVPDTLFAALYGLGVYTSSDGGINWAASSAGLDTTNVLALAMDPANSSILYVTTDQSAVYRSTNGGKSWSALIGGYPAASAGLAIQPDKSSVSPYDNHPFPDIEERSEQAGAPAVLPMLAATGLTRGNAVAISPFNSSAVLVGTTGRGIYRWNGSSWAATSLTTGTVYSLWFDRSTSGRVLASAGSAAGGVLVSTNNGQTWSLSNTGITGRTVYGLAQNRLAPSVFVAATNNGIYQSQDGGSTWQLAGLEGQVIKTVGVLPGSPALYFAGTDSRAFYSENTPDDWRQVLQIMENIGLQGILENPGGQSVYFYSRLGGIIRTSP